MPTECIAEQFDFGTIEGRAVEAAFDAGLVTSDAGALLLRATDRAIALMDRFAACFHDERRRKLIEHEVATLVGQRVFAIALGHEDLNDHDELRHDPMMAVLAGKLEARRADCAPVAGKSTLNRLELSELTPTRYHKISHNPIAIRTLLVDLFLEAHARPPRQIILDLDATDDPLPSLCSTRWIQKPSSSASWMTIKGKSWPVRVCAFARSSAKRANSPAISPPRTRCFDIFCRPGDKDVISQVARESSSETKIAPRSMRIAVWS